MERDLPQGRTDLEAALRVRGYYGLNSMNDLL